MREIVVNRFGGPEVLELVERPTPEPGPGEFRVDVEAVGVGWLDVMIRQGLGPEVFAVEPPYIPGGAMAGVVGAVGDGVPDGWLGARVLTRARSGGYGGGYVDTVITTPDHSVRVPDGLDLQTALALMDDGSTALALLERTPVQAGEVVLVAPGVGGLGNVLVQLALAAGARVIAAVRGPEKVAVAKELGAETVDYALPGWADQVQADVAFDGLGGEIGAAVLASVVEGGRFSSYGVSGGAETAVAPADPRHLTVADMTQLPEFWADTARRLDYVLAEAAAGRLRAIIGATYPLADAAVAHADIEARRFMGKLVLRP